MHQMWNGMDGPQIEEIVDHPSRSSSVFRDVSQHMNRFFDNLKADLQRITSKPGFNKSFDEMQKVIDLFDKNIDKLEHYEDMHGSSEELRRHIRLLREKRHNYDEKKEKARMEFFERRADENNRRREEARRRASSPDMDITDRNNGTRLNLHSYRQSYNQQYNINSSDEENYDVARNWRDRSPSRRTQSYNQSTLNVQHRDHSLQRSHHNMNDPSTSQPVRMRFGKNRVTKSLVRKWRPGQKAMAEIRKYQKSTDLLIQKAPFARLVHEIVREATSHSNDFRVRADAIMALQEAAEAFIVNMFEGSAMICHHAKRVTLMETDILLYRRLCLPHY